ncbi:hypothetical protein Tco_0102655, partial [Tanacetum coccineum]
MLTPPSNKYVITYTQLRCVQGVDTQDHVIDDLMRQLSFEETKLDGEAGFDDVARLPVSEEPDVGRSEEQPIVEDVIVKDYSSEDAGTNDDEDKDFLVDEENEIIEHDVDVHLFSISVNV